MLFIEANMTGCVKNTQLNENPFCGGHMNEDDENIGLRRPKQTNNQKDSLNNG